MKSVIVIYDSLCELDRTEVAYTDETNLKAIIRSLTCDYPDAELVEVYSKASGSFVLSYAITAKGKLVEKERAKPRRGGYRPGNENNLPHHPAVYKNNLTIPMAPEMKEALAPLGVRRAAYVRAAIAEKFEREGNPIPKPKEKPKQPEGFPDRRYHRMFKNLPPSVKTYDGKTVYRSYLAISRTPDEWLVSYGPYSPDIPGAPSTHNSDLLSALEWLANWLDVYSRKWIVGKDISTKQD